MMYGVEGLYRRTVEASTCPSNRLVSLIHFD